MRSPCSAFREVVDSAALEREKEAAICKNSSRVHRENGWSWHCALSISKPRIERIELAARFAGSYRPATSNVGGAVIAGKKLIAVSCAEGRVSPPGVVSLDGRVGIFDAKMGADPLSGV